MTLYRAKTGEKTRYERERILTSGCFQWKISLHNFHGTFSGICIVLYWKASCSTAAPRTNWLWLHWHSVIHINTVNVCMILAQQIVRKYIGHFVCETSNGTLDLVYLFGCGGEIHEPRISYHDKGDKYFVRIFSVTPQCWCHSLGLAFFSRHSATVLFFCSVVLHSCRWLVSWLALIVSLLLLLLVATIRKCSLSFPSWHWKMQLNKLCATL